MTRTTPLRPELFALLAAVSNGTIGPLNRYGFAAGASHDQIAFLKCAGAFLLLLVVCLTNDRSRVELVGLARRAKAFALLAFLGVFCLYFFETWAFAETSIPLVSFLTYAAGGGTLILSVMVMGERLTVSKVAAFVAILSGVAAIFVMEGGFGGGSALGIVLALAGGLGYALFIFFAKRLEIGGGLPHLVWLFGFGSLYLAIPIAGTGLTAPPLSAVPSILALIILPTIGGFWFTTRAVRGGTASGVQIIETSDPLFASLFALALFGETLTASGWVGAGLIMGGLLLALRNDDPPKPVEAARTAPSEAD